MHLKHVILDGFKSYKDRTDIGPFDPHFNAITGLNGSGKSNILDAICFVMGLSSMNVVRAANLSELIHKGGSGGVSRASASLVFDNKDKRPGKCPPGYEKYDEIIVSRTIEASGTCKFYLNSITSTKKSITDMFESIQLNVSNPNFMIMQGKITKVISMTPKQLLGMIEETVGGNVYQGKRDKAEQEVRNKDRCIEMVRNTIKQDLYPEWKRQKEARDRLQEFQTIEFQTNRALKNYAILKYRDLSSKLSTCSSELESVTKIEQEDDAKITQAQTQITAHKNRQEAMKKENTSKFKDRIEAAEKDLNGEKKRLVTVEAKLNTARMDVEDTKGKVAEAERAKGEREKEMADYKKRSANAVGEFEGVKGEIEAAEGALKAAKEMENALKLGNIVDEEGKACDARQELMRIQDEIQLIQPNYQVASAQHEEDRKRLGFLEKDLKKTPTNDQVERDYNTKLQKAETLKREALKRNINPDDVPAELLRSLNATKSKIAGLSQEKERLLGRLPNLAYRYDTQSVDSSKIHGCLFELIKLKNLDQWSGALEVLVGGAMGHFVVENQATAKALLRANLSRRTHVHPLDVFETHNNVRLRQADLDRKFGPGKAVHALDLVECDPKHRLIVQHFFANRVVCEDIETAKKCAFELGYYAVSKLGDVADPDGVMQGGTRRNLGQLMPVCESLRGITEEIKRLNGDVRDYSERLRLAKDNDDFMKQLEVAKRDLQNAEETRKMTSYSVLKREIEELEAKLATESTALQTKKMQIESLEKERKKWDSKVSQLETLREKNRKENAAQITKCEKRLEAAKKKYESKQKQFGDIDVEIKSKEALILDCQKDITTALEELKEYEEKEKAIKVELEAARAKFNAVKEKHDAAVAESNEWNDEFNQIEEEIKELGAVILKIELAKIKRGNRADRLKGNFEHCQNEIESLKKDHRAVNFERDQIDDNEEKSLQQRRADVDKLKKRHEELRERLDVSAAEACTSTKDLLANAEGRISTIIGNKQELLGTIGKLDDQKLTLVNEAYDRVNLEFNKMMGTLLPESSARLVPVSHTDLSQGVNIHVQLGGVWKESLSELSGGQRSLVALALVLSLCMYNPAPLYILDEIDAALDLNHTQNIGVLIRQKFTDTQFVCVSLKEGMYSNCNILFQVQFVNGRSEVKRCARQSSRKSGGGGDAGATTMAVSKKFNRIVSGK